jgi:hypothetical protein
LHYTSDVWPAELRPFFFTAKIAKGTTAECKSLLAGDHALEGSAPAEPVTLKPRRRPSRESVFRREEPGAA